MENVKKRTSLKTSLLLSIILLVGAICALFVVISLYSVNSLLEHQVSSELSSRAGDASKLVEQQINTYISQVEDIASREDVKSMDWDIQQPVLISEAERIGFERFQICYVDETEDHAVGDVISTTGDKAHAL